MIFKKPHIWGFGLCLLVIGALFGDRKAAAQSEDPATAVPTKVMVRAAAHDAKLLHDPVGGARITIRDVTTGEVLAEGLQKGSSGSTDKIIRTPRRRGDTVYDTPEAAGFTAELMLEEPTNVRITAEGPLNYPQAMQKASKTVLLVPGEDVLGDGIVLTIHGFIVELLEPENMQVHENDSLRVRARVRMTCGCPIKPGGLWDADRITVKARLIQENRVIHDVPLHFTGETSHFEAAMPGLGPGSYTLQIQALDNERANFGMDEQILSVESRRQNQ